MNRFDPIEYAERLYGAIRAANFSPISFLAFGNAIKDGVPMRSMPRIAVEPFMRIVGEMLDLEEEAAREEDITDADVILAAGTPPAVPPSASEGGAEAAPIQQVAAAPEPAPAPAATAPADQTQGTPEPSPAAAPPAKQKSRKGGEPRP